MSYYFMSRYHDVSLMISLKFMLYTPICAHHQQQIPPDLFSLTLDELNTNLQEFYTHTPYTYTFKEAKQQK